MFFIRTTYFDSTQNSLLHLVYLQHWRCLLLWTEWRHCHPAMVICQPIGFHGASWWTAHARGVVFVTDKLSGNHGERVFGDTISRFVTSAADTRPRCTAHAKWQDLKTLAYMQTTARQVSINQSISRHGFFSASTCSWQYSRAYKVSK